MGLIYCRQEPMNRPFYLENLGIHIWSSQELCYVIFNHPLIVMEDFIDESLLSFMRDEMDLGFLAMKLERWQKENQDLDELLCMILSDINYYTSAEIQKFRQLLMMYRKKQPFDFRRMRADAFFEEGQFGKAVLEYKKVLALPESSQVENASLGKVWNNLAAAYAGMFQMKKAYRAYEKAYSFSRNPDMIKAVYFLHSIDPDLEVRERLLSLITPELKEKWDEELKTVREHAGTSEKHAHLMTIFEKDPVRRAKGINDMLTQWKQEYRAMI